MTPQELFKQLEKLGTIIILDKQQGDYSITVPSRPKVMKVFNILWQEDIGKTLAYSEKYNTEQNTFTIDFNIYGRIEIN